MRQAASRVVPVNGRTPGAAGDARDALAGNSAAEAPARRIRVMHIADEMGTGGLPHVVATICHTVNRDRFEMSVLSINAGGATADELRKSGIRVLDAETTGRFGRYLAFRSIARHLRENPVDIVHTHNTQAFVDGTIAARIAGVRGIVHTDHARQFPDKRRYLFAEFVASQFAHRVIGVSDHTSEGLIRHVKLSRRKVATIPNGIVGDRFSARIDARAKRRALGIADGRPVLGIGARLVEQKAHDDLLQAVHLLRKRYPDILLLIAGEGVLEDNIRSTITDLGLEDNVRLMGVRHDIGELLQIFDIYVMPSIWEGLPMALLEAMAAGCAIVATHVGGIPTAIVDGVNGTTVPPRDTRRLAEAIDQLLANPELREGYVARGRERFQARFTAEIMTGAYEELYISALQRLESLA